MILRNEPNFAGPRSAAMFWRCWATYMNTMRRRARESFRQRSVLLAQGADLQWDFPRPEFGSTCFRLVHHRAAVLTIEGLETIDLSLCLPTAPGSFDRCQNGCEVLLKAKGKPDQRSDAALFGALNPPE